jgi:cation:H+ antiporter
MRALGRLAREVLLSEWIWLGAGGALLYFGAEWFVAGAAAVALSLRVPQLLVGLTVIAYGTSAPEVIVGMEAAAAGHGDVALGNVIGSNIANIGLILGCAALIRPARVDASLRSRELPVLVLGTALLPLLLFDGRVSTAEAIGLLVLAVAYTGWMVRAARAASAVAAAKLETKATGEAADIAGAPRPAGALRAAGIALVGLLVLLLGGKLFIDGAIRVASVLGMSERLVGLTIVAVGTSLPELVTSLIAAYRGHSDLAVGNVVGSNIFNVFLCLGVAALAGSVAAPLSSLAFDLMGLVLMTAMAAVSIRSERIITRGEGAIVLTLYAAFTVTVLALG